MPHSFLYYEKIKSVCGIAKKLPKHMKYEMLFLPRRILGNRKIIVLNSKDGDRIMRQKGNSGPDFIDLSKK